MTTNVDVCNVALGRIGQGASKPIQALTENSEAARACNRAFDYARRLTLRAYRWPWAQTVAPLAAVDPATQTVPGWAYVYAYPADCLYLHAVGGDTADPTQWPSSTRPGMFRLFRAADGQGQVIATSLPDAWGWYTADVPDVAFTDDHFRDALAWRLAAEIALGLQAAPDVAQFASQQFDLAVQTAAALAANQVPRQPRDVPENMIVRGVHGSGVFGDPWDPR